MEPNAQRHTGSLSPYLSPLGAWAFALGASIGWGSLVVTSNSYLLQAGPLGSIFGLLIGAVVMLVIGRNYHYLVNCFPDAGGAYTYSKVAFGHDYGFLTAWFLALTYLAMFWANITSLPLFARFFMNGLFEVGFHYTVFGYDVYLGEALLSIAAILLTALVCTRFKKAIMYFMIACVAIICIGITVCFASAATGHAGSFSPIEPGFLPDSSALSQVILIACISPWAFIGFENISHFSEEFAFSRTKTFRILVAAIASATVLYIFVFLLSVMAYPPQYDSWFAYLADLGNLSGIEALPPFFVAHYYLGDFGVSILMVTLLALVLTSLLANTVALSRLAYALGRDAVLPETFAKVNDKGIPANAVYLVMAISLVIPFLGRTAIGWIVDVTTIGATLTYCFVSAAALKVARARKSRVEQATGGLGIVLTVAIAAYLLLPSLFMTQSLEPESYFLFALWSIIGFALFRILLGRDTQRRFGRAIVVWVGLLAIVMFIAFVWMNQSLRISTDETVAEITAYYTSEDNPTEQQAADEAFVEQRLTEMEASDGQATIIAAALIILASIMLLTNFTYMSKRVLKSEEELDLTKDIVNTDPITGLPSMMRFLELAKEGSEAITAQGHRIAAIALDVVGMKDFNAQHGHEAGNKLLRTFAEALQKQFGETSCSRFAEDHFYAFAPEENAAELIESVFSDFKDAFEGNSLPIRAGVYVCAEEEDIVSIGFDRARAACDLDRKTWQSHISWFVDGMDEDARLRLHVLDSVDEAIEKRWIVPYYQAVVNAKTGNVCHEEALARWVDPEFGFLSPGRFIPILEEAGLLHKVDMHILDCVLDDMATKREMGVPIVSVSVNISLRDLSKVELADEIVAKVAEAGVSPALIKVEFTESSASDDPALFKAEVDALRAAGFEVWMDDFGSGYSSLNSLKDFDFDVIKLDMDFLRGDGGKKTWDVIAGVVEITRKIGIRSLAEGVEDESQAARLREIGCDMLQGYFYTKPRPLAEVIELFRSDDETVFEDENGNIL